FLFVPISISAFILSRCETGLWVQPTLPCGDSSVRGSVRGLFWVTTRAELRRKTSCSDLQPHPFSAAVRNPALLIVRQSRVIPTPAGAENFDLAPGWKNKDCAHAFRCREPGGNIFSNDDCEVASTGAIFQFIRGGSGTGSDQA